MPIQIQNTRIFGAEWVNNYIHPFVPRRTNLLHSHQNAQGFYDRLTGTGAFIYGDQWAWDQDVEHMFSASELAAADPPPLYPYGEGSSYAEKVDLLFFSGHGTQDGLLFGVPSNDNGEAKYDEVLLGLGGKLKWFVVDACKVLEETGVIFRWGRVFKGLRIMLGFHGNCRDVSDRGLRFANYLKGVPSSSAVGTASTALSGETIRHAWELACMETEITVANSWAYLHIGGDSSPVRNDKWTDDTVNQVTSNDFTYVRNVTTASS